ncbi:MAG: hypothetical protein AB1523_05835 [Bacillota bacterium]
MKLLKNEKGWAMPLALMLVFVVSLLGAALWQYSMTEVKRVERETKRLQAHYLARAGVEATRQAWLVAGSDPKPSGAIKTVYLNKRTKEFQTAVPASPGGQINVTASKDADTNEWTIISTGEVSGVAQTARATATPLVYGHEISPPWYDPANGKILPGPNEESVHDEETNTTHIIKYHDEMPGVVRLKADGNPPLPLKIQKDETDKRKVAYIAHALFFESPVDLKIDTKMDPFFGIVPIEYRQGFLIAAAENIIFEKWLDVRCDGTRGFFAPYLSYGVLVLYVPEGYGIPGEKVKPKAGYENKVVVDINTVYGKVFFNEVRTDGAVNNVLSNQCFYFKQKNEGVAIGNRWFKENGKWKCLSYTESFNKLIAGGDLIPADEAPPKPEDCLVFFWN